MSTWLSFFINLHHYTGITHAALKVDKNREKCVIFVYLTLQIRPARIQK